MSLLVIPGEPEPDEPGIALQTRDRWDIENTITADVPPEGVRQFQLLCEVAAKAGRVWHVRKPPTGGYNCAGHVFACRRTGVFGGNSGNMTEQVRQILLRDGYHRVRGPEDAEVGDVALYWGTEDRKELWHVGQVCEMRGLTGSGREPERRYPYILSKWSASAGECLHHFRHYPPAWGEVVIDFWTDRPRGAWSLA